MERKEETAEKLFKTAPSLPPILFLLGIASLSVSDVCRVIATTAFWRQKEDINNYPTFDSAVRGQDNH